MLKIKGDVDAELTKEVESNLPLMEELDLSKPGTTPTTSLLFLLFSFHSSLLLVCLFNLFISFQLDTRSELRKRRLRLQHSPPRPQPHLPLPPPLPPSPLPSPALPPPPPLSSSSPLPPLPFPPHLQVLQLQRRYLRSQTMQFWM